MSEITLADKIAHLERTIERLRTLREGGLGTDNLVRSQEIVEEILADLRLDDKKQLRAVRRAGAKRMREQIVKVISERGYDLDGFGVTRLIADIRALPVE